MPRRRADRECSISVDFERREIFSESQADVLFIEIQSGDPVASRRIQSKVAPLAPVLLVATRARIS